LFVEELDGETVSVLDWYAFESPAALAYEAEDIRATFLLRERYGDIV
jgi:hypothetical protein